MKVAIIGGGAAGLSALRNAPSNACVTLFERRKIGGLWNRPSAIYADLMTNIPSLVMAFPDFPFPRGTPSFPHHTVVKQYLDSYAAHYRIHDHIRYEEVKHVRRHGSKFLVDDEEFDAVLVANGHFSATHYDPTPFRGTQLHSSEFDDPSVFTDQNVMVLGAGASGTDIATLVAPVAKSVRWVHRRFANGTKPVSCPEKVTFLPSLSLDENGVMCDGWACGAIIHATGFRFTFPFLSEELRPCDEGRDVPRNKLTYGLFSTVKNLCFIGLQHQIPPFYVFHHQSQAAWRKLANWDLTCYEYAPQFDFNNMGGASYLYLAALLELDRLPQDMAWRQELYVWCQQLREKFVDFRRRTIEFAPGEPEAFESLRCDGIPLRQYLKSEQS